MSSFRPRADAGTRLRACGVWLGCFAGAIALSCGGAAQDAHIGVTERPAVSVAAWPPRATSPVEAVDVAAALSSPDGAQIRVRAYLIAITLPCPACNVRGQRPIGKEEDRIGKTARSRGPDLPGCTPCPAAAATFSDEPPTSSPSPSPSPATAPLRAVGSAEGLQARHVGHVFLITGTFHARGEVGPELEVSDVRAIEGP